MENRKKELVKMSRIMRELEREAREARGAGGGGEIGNPTPTTSFRLAICPKCGNDTMVVPAPVIGETVRCSKCGHDWAYLS